VRKALATLPWVEQGSIETNVKTHEVRFNLRDMKDWNEEDVRKAFAEQRFPKLSVKSLRQ
jgi:hypothetical protein